MMELLKNMKLHGCCEDLEALETMGRQQKVISHDPKQLWHGNTRIVRGMEWGPRLFVTEMAALSVRWLICDQL